MELEYLNQISHGSHVEPHQANGPLHSVSQAATILDVPVTWIYERPRKNAIPYRKMGKYIRFSDSDLSAILRMCSRGPRNGLTEI